ncbi:MAG: ABC transporter permease [Acidimicrobiia bacterium]
MSLDAPTAPAAAAAPTRTKAASVPSVVRTELYKQLRRPRTYTAYGLMALIPVIMTVALKANPPSPGDQGLLLLLASRSGLFIPAAALRFTSEFMLVIVVAIFGGEAIAGEAQWGNLRYLLMRPISRGRLFVGKFVVAMVAAFLAVVVVAAVGLVAGGIAFGLHPLDIAFGPFTSLSTTDVLLRLGFVVCFVAWTLTSVVAFSYMVGCMTDSSGGAIFAGIGLWMTWEILDQIDSLGSIRYVLPTHYSGSWIFVFTSGEWSDDLWRCALLTLGYVAVFVAFASWWFRRKDILS